MGAVYEVLTQMSKSQDEEMVEGIRRYEEALAKVLTPVQLETYAGYIQYEGQVRIFGEMSPDELAELRPEIRGIAQAILEDIDAPMENRRVVALLNQRGQHKVAPDLDQVRYTG